MGAICIYPNKISRLVTYTHNHDRRPCKRWDTPDFYLLLGKVGKGLPIAMEQRTGLRMSSRGSSSASLKYGDEVLPPPVSRKHTAVASLSALPQNYQRAGKRLKKHLGMLATL